MFVSDDNASIQYEFGILFTLRVLLTENCSLSEKEEREKEADTKKKASLVLLLFTKTFSVEESEADARGSDGH